MGLDTHICGNCNQSFTNLQLFIQHKNDGCNSKTNVTTSNTVTKNPGSCISLENELQIFVDDNNELILTTTDSNILNVNHASVTTSAVSHTTSAVSSQPTSSDLPTVNPGLVTNSTKLTGRKRGRPRKKKNNWQAEECKPENESLPTELNVEICADGKYSCTLCKKSFHKERHFNTHRCLAGSDYLDITKKDVMSDSDDEEADHGLQGDEFMIDSGCPDKIKQARKYAKYDYNGKEVDINVADDKEKDCEEPSLEDGHGVPPTVTIETSTDNPESLIESAVALEKALIPRVVESPLFPTEDEKREFEESLNVDLSGIDHMFRVHMIEQDVNTDTMSHVSRGASELTIYSCNTCDKVFKSLSHMRNHCLIHTNLKPFKCPKCAYASNSKGNLYTHMRKHTGQYYHCKSCDFKSVNRSHVIDHESIHTSRRQQCKLCQNDYSTVKSLVNHIRKYHSTTKSGLDYLQLFLSRQTQCSIGAVIHQCHICNRKFKKKIDRDRHLFVHNIVVHSSFKCEVCDYSTTRRCYLEYHIRKHRVIYCCAICNFRFTSTARMSVHLDEHHLAVGCAQPSNENDWATLFNACIKKSMFLPESDGTIDFLGDKSVAHVTINENCTASESLVMEEGLTNNRIHDFLASSDDQTHIEITTPSDSSLVTLDSDVNDANQMSVPNGTIAEKIRACLDDIYTKLDYKPLDMDTFNKIRETFGNHECQYCGRLFHHLIDLEPHLLCHTGDKPFVCDQCDYRSLNKDSLKRHLEKYHEKMIFSCTHDDCCFVATESDLLACHLEKHVTQLQSICSVCDLKFYDKRRLRVHMLSNHCGNRKSEIKKQEAHVNGGLGRRGYRCQYCSQIFNNSFADYQEHILIHEGSGLSFKCNLCSYCCRSPSNLKKHMLRHTDDKKPFSCEFCDKSYKSTTALKWHLRSHKNGSVFKCSKCPFEVDESSQLVKHFETHRKNKEYECLQCNLSAESQLALDAHNIECHNMAKVPEDETCLRAFKCLSCNDTFEDINDMRQHLSELHELDVENLEVLESEVLLNTENTTEVQVVKLHSSNAAANQMTTSALEALQCSGQYGKTAVNILQQIIDISQQDVIQTEQPYKVNNIPVIIPQRLDSSNIVKDNKTDVTAAPLGPETIIVQGSESDILLNDSTQFVIHLMNGDNIVTSSTNNTEISDNIAGETVYSVTVTD